MIAMAKTWRRFDYFRMISKYDARYRITQLLYKIPPSLLQYFVRSRSEQFPARIVRETESEEGSVCLTSSQRRYFRLDISILQS